MYRIKHITLKNKREERQVPVIEFEDPEMAIAAEFLMSDSPVIGQDVLEAINRAKAEESIEISGNRCRLVISQETTVINDLFADLYDDITILPSCELKNCTLRKLIESWREDRKAYEQ